MISIIIPNLNSKIIPLTLAALHSQNYSMEEAEVLVVGVDELNFVTEDRLVRHISTGKPVNAAAARNIGLRQSKGDPILFLDSDCIPIQTWVNTMVRSIRVFGAEVVGGAIRFPRGNLWTLADNVAMFRSSLPFTERDPRPFLPTLNLSFSRNVFLDVGELDETLTCSEDIDWTVRCRKKGYRLHFEPRAAVCHLPSRATFEAVMTHWTLTGRYMSEVLVRHQEMLHPPSVIRYRWLMVAFSPVIAAYLSGRLFSSALRRMYIYLDIFPLIFLAELAWCWGVFRGLPKRAARHGSRSFRF
ncbi:glycosyltransferase [Candidatus Bathyarchaeota archaeon]|nr:glycosyltransferase [Candidatus Bathyarchaeota archaeon]